MQRPWTSRPFCRTLTIDAATKALRRRMIDRLRQNPSDWEGLWREGTTPWDLGEATPVLEHELSRRAWNSLPADRLVTLVPGCGAGYELSTLVQQHSRLVEKGMVSSARVVGLDMSPRALDRAREVVESSVALGPTTNTELVLLQGDFFDASSWSLVEAYGDHAGADADDWSSTSFDLVFDYLFFCALPPDLRAAWGQQVSKLLADRGSLLTLLFPLLPPEAPMVGPPYPVSVEDYQSALEAQGLILDSEPYRSELSFPSRHDKELVAWWTKDSKG